MFSRFMHGYELNPVFTGKFFLNSISVMRINIHVGNSRVTIDCLFNGYNKVIDVAKSLCPGSVGVMIPAQRIKHGVSVLIQYFYHSLPGCTCTFSGPVIDARERRIIL
ncbi:hypothetical protein ES703_79901 [subsurface metagenome]